MADHEPDDVRAAVRHLRRDAVASLSDAYYLIDRYRLGSLASTAAANFSGDRGTSQMKGLETIARSATSVADVLDHIKSQAGRSEGPGQDWRKAQFADRLLGVLEDKVCADAERQAKAIKKALPSKAWKAVDADGDGHLAYNERELERELRLELCQAYLRHLVARYTYELQATRPPAR